MAAISTRSEGVSEGLVVQAEWRSTREKNENLRKLRSNVIRLTAGEAVRQRR